MYHRLRGLAASDRNQGKRSADATHTFAEKRLVPDVSYWPKADMLKNAIDVAIGGKADMPLGGLSP